MKNLAIVGGCGSSGTTLLAHLLSRHPAVVSGPEMKFFNHPDALSLEALRAHQGELFERRRLPGGYHVVPTFLRAGREFGIDRALFARWLEASEVLADVYSAFADHMCAQSGTTLFVEKTPSNVYSFAGIADQFPELPLIQQLRDGRDVVVSLRRRNKSLFHAASLWLFDTVSGLRVRGRRAYLETRYEDLVREPDKTLGSIFAHLALDAASFPRQADAPTSEGTYEECWHERRTPRAWNQTPSEPVSPKSVGQWRKRLTPAELSTIYRVRLSERSHDELESPVWTFAELLDFLGYGSGRDEGLGSEPVPRRIERTREARDYLLRAGRTLRYRRRLPRRLTAIGPGPRSLPRR